MRRYLKLICLVGIVLCIFLAIPLSVRAANLPPPGSSAYSVLGPPTVSAAFIDRVLTAYGSPAAGKGQALYDEGVAYGIDPVFALAFFMHESSFGTAGMARVTFSLGNLRCIPDAACVNGYAAFQSWESGFDAWYKLIRNVYAGSWGLTTVAAIIPRYAPASDHNNESAYIAAVESSVDAWRSQQIGVQGTGPSSTGSTTGSSAPSGTPYYPPDGYKILGKPTISVQFIEQVLTAYHSPAVGHGQALYDDALKYGIDPAYALAFFMHDSIFGTVGLARVTHALSAIPTPVSATCHCQALNGYRQYDTWEDGFSDWYSFINEQYIKHNLTTIGQIIPAYAHTQNSYAIASFIQAVEHRVDVWRSAQAGTTQPHTT